MGGQNNTSTYIEKEISQEIGMIVNNSTKTISNIMNETVSKVSTKLVQESAAAINQNMDIKNILENEGGISAVGKGSVIDISQQAKAVAEGQAIANIVSNNTALAELANKAASEMLQKAGTENKLQQEAQQLAAIQEKSKDSGGPEKMIASLTGMVTDSLKALTGGGSNASSTDISRIRSKVKTELNNSTLQESTLSNILKSTVENSFSQSTSADCKQMMNASNNLKNKGGIQAADGGVVRLAQSLTVTNLNKCIMSMAMGNSVASKLGVEVSQYSKQETDNKTTGSQVAEQSAKMETIKENTSSIMNSFDNLVNGISSLWTTSPTFMYMVIGVAVCGVLGAVALSMGGGKKKDDGYGDRDSDDQMGGNFNLLLDSLESEVYLVGGGAPVENYGNVYLWAMIAVLVYYVFGKSLPKSSALVIAIICYIIYVGNKN